MVHGVAFSLETQSATTDYRYLLPFTALFDEGLPA